MGVRSNEQDCGGCGRVGGTCVDACSNPTLTYCFGSCVDTQVDHNDCGVRGRACTTAQNCVGGDCVYNAAHPDVCSGACVNKDNDPASCGTCGHHCGGANPMCVGGTRK